MWESYAIYHAHCGLTSVGTCKQDNYSVVIPNYFDPQDFEYNDKKDNYFLYLGRVYEGKGVHIAIDACIKANVKLIIAGPKADSFNILKHENVEFIGYANIEKRKELMKGAIASLLPSQYLEPFGGVQIENLLSGTPTITSDWGGFAENNIHGITGYRCRTMGDYVDAILECKKGTIKSKDCRKWGENFLFNKIAPRYEKYFKDVMDVYIGKGWYSSGNGLFPLIQEYPEQLKDTEINFETNNQYQIILYSHSDCEDLWPATLGVLEKYAKNFEILFVTNKNPEINILKNIEKNVKIILYDESELCYSERVFLSFKYLNNKNKSLIFLHEDWLLTDYLCNEKILKLENFMMQNSIDYLMSYDTTYMDSFNSEKKNEVLIGENDFLPYSFYKMRLPYFQPALWNINAFKDIFELKIDLKDIEGPIVAKKWGTKKCYSIQHSETIGTLHTLNSYFFPHFHACINKKFTFIKYPTLKTFLEGFGIDTSKKLVEDTWCIKVIENILVKNEINQINILKKNDDKILENIGISFMVRIHNEELTLEESIRSIFQLKNLKKEIVLILHNCTDLSESIANQLQKEWPSEIKIYKYTEKISRAGYENFCTDENSVHSLSTFNNFCLSKCSFQWNFRWDSDFIMTKELSEHLEKNLHNYKNCKIRINAENEFKNWELYLSDSLLTYKKYVFWEVPTFKQNAIEIKFPEEAKILHHSKIQNIKNYWNSAPWFLKDTFQENEEALHIKHKINELETKFGKEPKGLCRASNPECDSFFLKIRNYTFQEIKKIYVKENEKKYFDTFLHFLQLKKYEFQYDVYLNYCPNPNELKSTFIYFNTEQLTRKSKLEKVLDNVKNSSPIEVWDYSKINIEILKQYNIQAKHIDIVSPKSYIHKILSYKPQIFEYDVGFVGAFSERRKKILRELVKNEKKVMYTENIYGEERDKELAKCKIILNIHCHEDFQIFELARCEPWIQAGYIVISENSMENDYRVINTSYENLVDEILKHV